MAKTKLPFRTGYEDEDFPVLVPDEGVPSVTQQHMAAECDINNIMKRFEKTGLIDHVSKYQAAFADVSDLPDYHTALNFVNAAREGFIQNIPASVRAKFNNDPGAFLEFVNNPENAKALVEMGLASPSSLTPAEPSVAPVGGVAAPVQGAEGSGA